MSGPTRSDRDQVTYRTYDGREVSQETIEKVLGEWEARQRRRERWRQIRVWLLAALIVVILLAASLALAWWRFGISL